MNNAETLSRLAREYNCAPVTPACLAGAAAIRDMEAIRRDGLSAGEFCCGEVKEQLAARVAELEVQMKRTYCAYCGEEFLLDDESASQVSHHIATCAKHPMRAVERDRDRLRALLLEAQNGGDAFRAPQDWWARVALAGPATCGECGEFGTPPCFLRFSSDKGCSDGRKRHDA
jgi:hypothetical protein